MFTEHHESISYLDNLCRKLNYSWTVGRYTEYGFVARAWKKREKPITVRCVGGGDIKLFQYRLCSFGGSIEECCDKLSTLLNMEEPTWPRVA